MTEIPITKEMLEAGHEVYRNRWNRHPGLTSMKVVIEEIYRAMRALEPKPECKHEWLLHLRSSTEVCRKCGCYRKREA